jgi:hypothetical protein
MRRELPKRRFEVLSKMNVQGIPNELSDAAASELGLPNSRAWTWRVFFTCWLVYTVLWAPYIVREHFPAIALAERGSMNVDRYLGWTPDIFQGPRGGAYINNNPGASLTAAIPLLLLGPVLARVDEWNQKLPRPTRKGEEGDLFWRTVSEGRALYFLLIGFLTVALVMAPATAGTAAYLCARLAEAGIPLARAAGAAVLYGLGTPVLFRAGHLNHNLLVGDAGFVALLMLWDPNDSAVQPWRAGVAGLLAGYAVLCDYSGAVVILVVALYLWLRSAAQPAAERWRLMAAFGAGVLPGVIALAVYQTWAFGLFYRPSQHYMPATAPTALGYRGFYWPSPALLWANFFDPRFGLFVYCPALILAFAAPFVKRVRYRIPRRETIILLSYFVAFTLFCAANQYSWLQPTTGFRYLVPVVPALALLAMQAAQALPKVVCWIIAIASCAQSLAMAMAHQNDVRLVLGTLLRRGFAVPWMIRLSDIGICANCALPQITFTLLGFALAFIWLTPGLRNGYHPAAASDSYHPARS